MSDYQYKFLTDELAPPEETGPGIPGAFVGGLKKGLTLGYAEPGAPPQSFEEKAADIGGQLVGFAPAALGASMFAEAAIPATVAGLTRLILTEGLAGAGLGAAQKPEEGQTRAGNIATFAGIGAAGGAAFGIGRKLFQDITSLSHPEAVMTAARDLKIAPENAEAVVNSVKQEISANDLMGQISLSKSARPLEMPLVAPEAALTPETMGSFEQALKVDVQQRNQLPVHTDTQYGELLPPAARVSPQEFFDGQEIAQFDKEVLPVVQGISNQATEARPFRKALAEGGDLSESAVSAELQQTPPGISSAEVSQYETRILSQIKKAVEQVGYGKAGADAVESAALAAPRTKADLQLALQKGIVKTIEDSGMGEAQTATFLQSPQPVEFLLQTTPLKYEEAANLVDNIAARAELAKPNIEINVERIQLPTGAGALPTPKFEDVKDLVFTPQNMMEMIGHTPMTEKEALEKGFFLPAPGGVSLTQKGMSFMRKFNPEFLMPLAEPVPGLPETFDRKLLLAVRGRGFANVDLTPQEVKTLGIKMGTTKALDQGFLRPGGVTDSWQLTDKGAAFVAGAKGAQGSKEIQALDLAAGRRFRAFQKDEISQLKFVEIEDRKALKDVIEQWEKLGKFPPDCL